MSTKYIKLGAKASTFYDQYTGLNISGKEVVEIDEKYINKSKKIQNALNGGHLVYTEKPSNSDELKSGISKKEVFLQMVEKGFSAKEIKDKFSREELAKIADEYELEVEDSDTKEILAEAIIEEIKGE